MARKQFVAIQGELDEVPPEQLYAWLTRYQKKYKLRTRYSALTEILQNAISMDRTPMERRMGADFDQDDHWKQSGTSQVVRRVPRSKTNPPKSHDI